MGIQITNMHHYKGQQRLTKSETSWIADDLRKILRNHYGIIATIDVK